MLAARRRGLAGCGKKGAHRRPDTGIAGLSGDKFQTYHRDMSLALITMLRRS
jgi:hypothetical protein